MSSRFTYALALMTTFGCGAALADTVALRNGQVFQGKFAGGTATAVHLQTANGLIAIGTADILSVSFDKPAPPPPPPRPAVPAGLVSVPAGTLLTVKMDMQVSSKSPTGTKFSARLLGDLTAGNFIIARAGTTVYGVVEQSRQAGRLVGKSKLQLGLTGIQLAGTIAPIQTTDFAEAGQGSFKKTARNTAAGAIIGNQFGSSGTGAAVGLGVSLIREGDSVTVPAGAILEFRLIQPLDVRVQ